MKTLYGSGLNTHEYFRKFWHRTVPLPKPDDAAMERLRNYYLNNYFNIEGKRYSALNMNETNLRDFSEMALAFGLTPRQMKEAFRMMGFTFQTSSKELRGQLKTHIGRAYMMLCFIKVGRPKSFSEFLGDPAGHGIQLIEQIDKVVDQAVLWSWRNFVLSGCYNPNSPNGLDAILGSLRPPNFPDTRKEIHEMSKMWGYHGPYLWAYAKQVDEAGGFSVR